MISVKSHCSPNPSARCVIHLKSATLPEDVAQAKVHDLDIIMLVQEKVLGPSQVGRGSLAASLDQSVLAVASNVQRRAASSHGSS